MYNKSGGDKMNICDFGTILNQLRKSHSLTQKELGAKVGLSKAVVSKYENGIGFPNFDTLIQFANYFGVTTDYLLGVEKSKTIDATNLTESQIEAIQRIIAEFHKHNKK